MIKILPKQVSYSAYVRPLYNVKFIVIHYTACNGDTAINEGNYFKNVNTAYAGAHFFVDRIGEIVYSVPIDRAAWAVGGNKYNNCKDTGGGKYYDICYNDNSVSIELCDIADKYPSRKQKKAVKRLIRWIRKRCPNATQIIRHFDVNGKPCPATMSGGMNNLTWLKFIKEIGE